MKKNIHKYREFLVESIKDDMPDCGWKKIPSVLEFHHLEEGEREPTRTRRSRTVQPHTHRTVEKMEEEMTRGCLLCPTCHKCRHYNEELDILDTANKNLR